MFRKGGESAAFLVGNTRKVHTTFEDGSELVEEYEEDSKRLTLRKRRGANAIGTASGPWEVLMGDPAEAFTNDADDGGSTGGQRVGAGSAAAPGAGVGAAGALFAVSTTQPACVREDAPGAFVWRINNLPYDAGVFRVAVDRGGGGSGPGSGGVVVVSTTNKKYYKRLELPEMRLLRLELDDARLSWRHGPPDGATLTVEYAKPPALLAAELADAQDAHELPAELPPVECAQQ